MSPKKHALLQKLQAKHPNPHAWHRLGTTSFEFRVKRVDMGGVGYLFDDWRPCRPPSEVMAPHAEALDDIRAEVSMLLAIQAEQK